MPDYMDHVQELQAESLARHVDAARLKSGGAAVLVCVDCDRSIPAERRAAHPTALRCVHCQSLLEANARHYRGQA
ncbi:MULTISPECIES: TraR/DksA C4-type zinc finger protein [Scandinavium]|jgi:phage/conjugal plasmid C-4 type zinc finger TraR family protein|uniref:TraR/DksA C4-type zinc finger protein n=1 Tax=Scandinavium TaxID=2726810 RepID=UPI0021668A23|nr:MULTISPECIES: TraR/DksA C4-type zinc finger protein [Scandinavium]MCS2150285.1 TraR/DksA C4-type zinc finger protein [Scandinavium manionii]MCS2169077.1 TraR/DksA C4-type zinc finger protein [Scandinavium tedordense]